MVPEVVKVERRGRKRKRKNMQNASVDKKSKKTVVDMRSKVLVGSYVMKEFVGSGAFLGKIVSYDTGLYRVNYEDGDCEDLETGEVKLFIVEEDYLDDDLCKRKKALDEYVSKKYAKDKTVNRAETVSTGSGAVGNGIANRAETMSSGGGAVGNAVELANVADKVKSSSCGGAFEGSGAQTDFEGESSSDLSDYEQSGGLVEVESPSAPPPQLPPSSGNFGVAEEHVSHLLSVYSFLRSFSVCLFLSPFGLDEFVGALNSTVPNSLLDAIHVALIRALKSHVEIQSSEGSELASKCLRSMDWSLLDSLTWPVFIVQYLLMMRYAEGPEWKDFYFDVLERDYHTLSAGRKLIILQLLCDDALDSAEPRAEVEMREASEVGPDPDGVYAFTDENVPTRIHLSYSRTSCKDQGAVKHISEGQKMTLSSSTSSSVLRTTGSCKGVAADVDIHEDGNSDECRLCGMDGTLLCCDGCPSAYHSRCVGVSKMFIPQGAWYCPECTINRIGPNVTRVTSLNGAELFGIDPYGQVFLGTCDHLLVMKAEGGLEPHIWYYTLGDVKKVLCALTYSAEYRNVYLGICKGILQYWEIPEDVFSLTESDGLDKILPYKMVDGEYSTSSTLLAKEDSNAPGVIDAKNIVSGVTKINSVNVMASCGEKVCIEPGLDHDSLDERKEFRQLDQRMIEHGAQDGNFIDSAGVYVETTRSTCPVRRQQFPSELNQQSLGAKLNMKESTTSTSGNGNFSRRNHVNTACDVSNVSSHRKELQSSGRGYGSSADRCLYMGSSFKPQAYLNLYINGDFAASAAASLAILSSEEKLPSQPQPSSSNRKTMSANFSLQAKAFSEAAKRFFWPNYEKKLIEVPRERCGWCLSCKAAVSSKKGCLLNAAALNAIKGAVKILASLHLSKNMEGSLDSIATYVMFMEESLCGLTVGPFLSPTYRKQWRIQVEQATTLSAIKASLLELEGKIRSIAFSADWTKLVDDTAFENPVTQSTKSAVESTQRRGPGGRRGRKPSRLAVVTDADGKDVSTNFAWWRGGMLSKHILQKGILPQSMIKNAAQQGGSGKIKGVQYVDGFEVPKRSRQFLWRAAVEMSKTVSQLALQVRYLDLHVRWNDLVRPEQPLQDGKGSETEASAFRNACIVDKKVVENKVSYGIVFQNQKHLPSRVLKNILEVEEHRNGKEIYWFIETRIPLYLIKEYEKKVENIILPSAYKSVNTLSNLQRMQSKASGNNIFSFLLHKRDNLGKCLCASCQLDVSYRTAARCSTCQGYCHVQCAVSTTIHMKERIEFLTTCKQCCHEKDTTRQNEIVGDSPTSPLALQGQEYLDQSSVKNPTLNNPKVTKSANQNGRKRPLESLAQSSEKKRTTNGSSLGTKKSRSKLSFGLIWKKKNPEDTGIDFRLKNLLFKDNPNGHLLAPVCQLCTKPYNSDLMYIRCETCNKWYHAVAVELEESRILDLVGFKCCRCRRIRTPVCPYTDPETRKKLEAKRLNLKIQNQTNFGSESISETIDEQTNDSELDSTSILDMQEATDIQADDPVLSSFPKVEQKTEVDFECGAGPGPKKLPVRRHIKMEKESDVSANNLAFEPSTTYVGNTSNPAEESSTPKVEWDVSANGFADMMFDYDDLNYEDMEFEPQTYFSVKELLASDDAVVSPTDMIENFVNPSTASKNDCNPEQYQMGITYDHQKPMFSVEPGVDIMPCKVCSQTEPCPNLLCQICGLWIHKHCSPWSEDSSLDSDWKCGNCREWR